MTLGEITLIIQDRLGFRSDKEEVIHRNVRLAQTELENGDIIPWFLLTHAILPSIPDYNDRVIIPTGYLGLPEEEEHGVWLVLANESEPIRLSRDDWEIIASMRKAGYGGLNLFDIAYQEEQGYVLIAGPGTIDEPMHVALSYYSSARALEASGDTNAWLEFAPEYLIGMAGQKVAIALRDTDAVTLFRQAAADARRLLIVADTRHRESGSRGTIRYVPKGGGRMDTVYDRSGVSQF